MERKGLVICSVVGFLGLLSAVLGFAAEATRIRASQVKFLSSATCEYPSGSSPAVGLGVAAAMALLLAQIIINVMTGCICCCRRGPHQSNPNWPVALICFLVSWFTFVVAFLLLLTAAALNDQRGEESMDMSVYYCYVVKPGVFAVAALLALASVGLGIFYYVTLKSTKNNNNAPLAAAGGGAAPNQTQTHTGIAMGQPQFTSSSSSNTQDPVFVHEDTYIRRQFT